MAALIDGILEIIPCLVVVLDVLSIKLVIRGCWDKILPVLVLRNPEMADGSLQCRLAHGADHFRRDGSGVLFEAGVAEEGVVGVRDMVEVALARSVGRCDGEGKGENLKRRKKKRERKQFRGRFSDRVTDSKTFPLFPHEHRKSSDSPISQSHTTPSAEPASSKDYPYRTPQHQRLPF